MQTPVEVRLEMGFVRMAFEYFDGTLEIVALSQGKPTSVVLISFNKSCRAVGHICIGIAIIAAYPSLLEGFVDFFSQSTVNSLPVLLLLLLLLLVGIIAAACRRFT